VFDLGGGADYKRKFGGPRTLIPYVRKSRVPGMLALRDLAAYVYKRRAMRAGRPAPRPAPAPTAATGRAATPFPRATARGLESRSAEAEPAPAERDPAERP
jgi:hypothetical protein